MYTSLIFKWYVMSRKIYYRLHVFLFQMTLDFDQWYSGTKYIELIHGGYVLTGDMKITGAAVKLRIPNYHVSVVNYTPGKSL